MPALGGTPRKVAPAPPKAYRRHGPPAWSPDGRRLAHVTSTGVADWYAETVSLGRGDAERFALPGPVRPRGWHLSWSPDGRYFAYATAWDEGGRDSQVWVTRLADGEAFPVTEADTLSLSPSFSPDSRSIYFVSDRGGSMDLWQRRLAADGRPTGSPRRLTTGIEMLYARFSPDGSRLAYSKGRQTGNIWRVPTGTDRPATWADAQQLTDEQGLPLAESCSRQARTRLLPERAGRRTPPQNGGRRVGAQSVFCWTPSNRSGRGGLADGQLIAFHSQGDVWVVPRFAVQAVKLTEHEGPDGAPSWSPDGREIAYVSIREGQQDIWIVPAQGGEARQLTDDPAQSLSPSWSPDGLQLAVPFSDAASTSLGVIPAAGGQLRLLTKG